jgi:hypothetical protein
MTLVEEYINCCQDKAIINTEAGDILFKQLISKISFHEGGRIDTRNNYVIYRKLKELKKILLNKNINHTEKIILLPSNMSIPILEVTLKTFYDCFDDCLSASCDIWIVIKKYKIVIECNHDNEIIFCENIDIL